MKKVFWDKGHGGTDPGAVGHGLQEKNIVSKIIDYADAYLLVNYDGVQTRMSRTNDETLTLAERTDAANIWGADVFISAHVNAATNVNARGFETFRHTNASAASTALQNVLHSEIMAAIKQFGDIPDRNQKAANFSVLRLSRMPAVLTEVLFISNTADTKLLSNEKFLKVVGVAHAVGVAKFLGLPPKKASNDDITGHWAETSIRKAMKKDIIRGYNNGSFGPNDNLTRAQLAVILDRMGVLD